MRSCLLLAALLAVSISGCGGDHEDVVEEVLAAHQQMNDILENAGDDAKPDEVAAKLQKVMDRLKRAKKQAAQLGTPPAATDTELKQEYDPLFAKEKARTKAIIEKLKSSNPALLAKVTTSLAKLE